MPFSLSGVPDAGHEGPEEVRDEGAPQDPQPLLQPTGEPHILLWRESSNSKL